MATKQTNNYNLKPIWDAILDIYNVYVRICERHQLRHWAAYGTLLGAVRNKGFIPWDDDFDVHMIRDEYDRFVEIAETELPSNLKIITWRNSEHNDIFCKIQDMRQGKLLELSKKSGLELNQGLFIDIFPLDGVPSNIIDKVQECVKRKIVWTRYLRLFRKGSHSTMKGWLGEIAGIMLAPFTGRLKEKTDFLEVWDRWARRHSVADSKLCCRYFGRDSGWGWMTSSKVFEGTVYIPFESVMVPAPIGWKEYLVANYGDFMKLPSEEKRKPSHSEYRVKGDD